MHRRLTERYPGDPGVGDMRDRYPRGDAIYVESGQATEQQPVEELRS